MSFKSLIGKNVEVFCEDRKYTGKLVEANDKYIRLECVLLDNKDKDSPSSEIRFQYFSIGLVDGINHVL